MNSAKVISFVNYKGGVGKTTTTYHVGCALAHYHNKKVLMIDIDPQSNLTFLCKNYEDWEKFKAKNGTIAQLYQKFHERKSFDTARTIWHHNLNSSLSQRCILDLLPCDVDLLGEDLGGASTQVVSGVNPLHQVQQQARLCVREWSFLKQIVMHVRHRYDYILIDCPPNIYLMTQNALVASDFYVVTTIPEFLSTIGLRILERKVRRLEEKVAQTAKVAGEEGIGVSALGGIIFVKVRVGSGFLTRQHEGYMHDVQREYPKFCFDTYTTELIGYSEAAERRLPVWMTHTDNAQRAARKKEYEKITTEFVRRFP